MREGRGPILVVAGTGFLRAYAGTLYLVRALESMGHRVSVVVPAKEDELAEYGDLGISVDCLLLRDGNWFLRKWDVLRMRLGVLRRVMQARRVIVTENRFFREASLAKKIRGNGVTIGHFCQELHFEEDYPEIPHIRAIERWARLPDFVVDVEPNRARTRRQKLALREMPLVLRSTLPRGGVPERRESGGLGKLAGVDLPTDTAIVMHMGGVGREKPLERVIDALASCSERTFFLAFCNTSEEKIEELRRYAKGRLPEEAFAILGPRQREALLACAWEADIGVIDYTTSVEDTTNQRFCAPTKLYEFMALGLAVVGSNSDSLREVVEGEGVGYCAEGNTTKDLGVALGRLLKDRSELEKMSDRAFRAFQERHCYEGLCLPVVEEISRRLESADS